MRNDDSFMLPISAHADAAHENVEGSAGEAKCYPITSALKFNQSVTSMMR